MFKWANNNWIKSDKKTPENLDLIQAYYDWYQKGYRIDLRKVKGHSGQKWNEMADGLATGRIHPGLDKIKKNLETKLLKFKINTQKSTFSLNINYLSLHSFSSYLGLPSRL